MSPHGLQPIAVSDDERGDYPKIDENFDNFVGNWPHLRDRLTIFLGAGASVGARDGNGEFFPTAAYLRNELWREFMLSEAEQAQFDYSSLGLMSLEHAAAIVEAKVGRDSLIRHLQRRFAITRPLWQHCVLAHLRPKGFFTTNYDRLVEEGWNRAKTTVPIDDLFQVFSPAAIPTASGVLLFKPHGTVEYGKRPVGEGGFVISQFDYFQMISDHKTLLDRFLLGMESSCVLFMGYSFLDMDIGSYIWSLRKKDSTTPWYAVFPRNDPDVRRMYLQQFNIRQINRRFHDFLADLDKRISFIPDRWKFSKIKRLQTEGLVA
jgi:hypothetical protein